MNIPLVLISRWQGTNAAIFRTHSRAQTMNRSPNIITTLALAYVCLLLQIPVRGAVPYPAPPPWQPDPEQREHLRRSLTYNPNSAASLYFLAETLIDMGRRDEARAALQKLIDAPIDPEWAPEDREFKDKAKALTASLAPKR